jgi:AcrR family transcriptional regulator
MSTREKNTKQRILTEALSLFAVKGYEPVTVAEIASAVGIKAPSLYKHYKSKQEIFEAIFAEMETRYEQQSASMQLDGRDAENDKDYYMNMSEERLVEIGKGLFLFFLHDEYTSKIRKIITIEQYNNPALSAMNAKRFIDDSLSYQETLFGMMVKTGVFIKENPKVMALHFYSPMYLLMSLCDCHPDRENEALQMIEQHIRQFNRLYRKERGSNEI